MGYHDDQGNWYPDDGGASFVGPHGDELFNNDPNADGTAAFSGALADFILYGVLNGTFSIGPGRPDDYIGVDNPMPYWGPLTRLQGTSIRSRRVADSGSPSGYSLRFEITNGATNDEAYHEQIVPIGGGRGQDAGNVVRALFLRESLAAGAVRGYVALQYLDASGSPVGNATETTSSSTPSTAGTRVEAFGHAQTASAPPATAYYLRIRIGVRVTSVAAATAEIEVSDVRNDRAFKNLLIGSDAGSTSPVRLGQLSTSWPASLQFDGGNGGIILLNPQTQRIAIHAGSGAPTLVESRALYIRSDGAGGTTLYVQEGMDGWNPIQSATAHIADTSDAHDASAISIADAASVFAATDVEAALAELQVQGTFTPTLEYTTPGTSSWVFTSQVGRYTKIGRMVTVYARVVGTPTNGTASGNIRLAGLPFTAADVPGASWQLACFMGGWTKAGYTAISPQVILNTTTAFFAAYGSGVAPANLVVADIPSGGSVVVQMSGVYET